MHGGAEKVLVNLANHLPSEHYDVTIATMFDAGVNRQFIAPHVHYHGGLRHLFPGNSILFLYIPRAWLWKMLLPGEYDLAVAYLEGITTRVLAGFPHAAKRIAWVHIEQQANRMRRGFRSMSEVRRVYDSYDHIVCVSQGVKDNFLFLCPTGTPVSVLYNVNETDRIIAGGKEPVEDSRFRNDLPTLIGVGKILPNKGFLRLARIHQRLLMDGIQHRIYLLGVGDQQREIEAYCKEHHLESTFIFLGYDANPYKYVAKCSAFVCSSFAEGFSTAATEAIVLGVPVITTEVAGMKELLGENNEYGIIVPNDEEALYQGLKKLLTTPGMLDDYRIRAEERGKMFSLQKNILSHRQFFEKVLNS